MMEMIQIPQFDFEIGDHIIERNPNCTINYVIYDISYSLADKVWSYRYKYWEGGYEHYCKSTTDFVERNFIHRSARNIK